MTEEEIVTKAFIKVGWNVTQTRIWEAIKCQDWLFSRKFAEPFWGENPRYYTRFDEVDHQGTPTMNDGGTDYIPNWKHHLQEVVLEENRLKYLERFL